MPKRTLHDQNIPSRGAPPEFGIELKVHLQALNWTQARLASEAGVSEAQLSGWLKSNPRGIARNHVCRIAEAIARGYDKKGKAAQDPNSWGIDYLDALLNTLLLSAGFAAIIGRPRDRVPLRLSAGDPSQRRLHVGWTPYKPFSHSIGLSRTRSPELEGIAVDITTRVADLTGLELVWQQCEWSQIADDLQAGSVDLMCPVLMLVPTRMVQRVQLSKRIPFIELAVNAIAHRDLISEARKAAAKLGDKSNVSTAVRVAAYAIEGEVGATLRQIIFPIGHLASPLYANQKSAMDDVVASPIDEDSKGIKCLVADHTICAQMIRDSKQVLETVYDSANLRIESPVKLPIAFAAHTDEPQLIDMINTCITLLRDSGSLRQLILQHKDILVGEYGVIIDDDSI